MKKFKVFFLVLMFMVFLFSDAMATYIADISYDYIANGGGNYTFNFNVRNTSTGGDTGRLDFFNIYFDADADISRYSGINWIADNGWYSEAGDPDLSFGGLPGYALADDSVLVGGGGGIGQGGSLAGFSVNFGYSGALSPTAQLFNFNAQFGTDATGNILGSYDGTTRYEDTGVIPEPSTFLLIGAGLVGIYAARKRKIL